MSNLQAGQTFGNYTVISELSSAGPLATYRAYSTALARDVTLALLSPEQVSDESARAHFQQAVQALRALKHPHLPAVLDGGKVDGMPYVAMQSVDAHTLAEEVGTGSLSLADMTRVVGQAGDALDYLLANGMAPAALTPDTVLRDEHGDVYLADLGLTRLLTSGGAQADPRAAAYALGSLLAALVTGHMGAGADLNEALQHLDDSEPLERRAALASAYERVIRQATADNPAERFASPADLVTAWQQAGAAAGPAAQPGGPPPITPAATVRLDVPPPVTPVTPAPLDAPPLVTPVPLDAPSVSTTVPGPASIPAAAAVLPAAQDALNAQREVLRRLLHTIQLVALKQARDEEERLKRQYGLDNIERVAPAIERAAPAIERVAPAFVMPPARLGQAAVSAEALDALQRRDRLVRFFALAIGVIFCGVPLLCFACAKLLPATSDLPTAEDTAVPVALSTDAPAPPIRTTLVFTDEFTTGDCNLIEAENERRAFKCENGEYTMLGKIDGSRWAYYDDEYEDTVVEVDAHAVSGPSFIEYGLVFRVASDGKSLYGFTLTREGKFTVFRYQDDSFTDLLPYTASGAVNADTATNHLKVVMQGNRISVYANDFFLGSVTDSNLQRGAVGLFLNSDSANAKAAFSHLRISTIEP